MVTAHVSTSRSCPGVYRPNTKWSALDLHHHHASANLEVLGPLRSLSRLHRSIARGIEETLSPRSGLGPVGRSRGKNQKIFVVAVADPGTVRKGVKEAEQHSRRYSICVPKNVDELKWDRRHRLLERREGETSRKCSAPTLEDARVHAASAKRASSTSDDEDDHRCARHGRRRGGVFCARDRCRASSSTTRTSSIRAASSIPFGIAQIGKELSRNEITPQLSLSVRRRVRADARERSSSFCKPVTSPEWCFKGEDRCYNWYLSLGLGPKNALRLRRSSSRRS